jgi:hypothetical protein
MIAYPALFFSYFPLLFSAISIHIGFNSFYHSSHKFSLPKDLLKLNYSALLHIHSSNEQTHLARDGHVNMTLVVIVLYEYTYWCFIGSDEQEFTQLKTKETFHASAGIQDDSGSTRSLILLVLIFLTAVAMLSLVYLNFPKLTQ